MELLELQARARAIRSQLALEPVTKIELDDSDSESPSNDKEIEPIIEQPSKSSQNNGGQKDKVPSSPTEEQSKLPATRPVRLKRNFRQRQMEGYESDGDNSVTDKEKNSTNSAEPQSPEKQVMEKEKTPEKEESPVKETEPVVNDDDVVPLIVEPEILCISSSDSESEEQKSSNVKKYINMPVVEKVVRPPTEDELFLLKIKEKSEAMNKTDTNVSKEGSATDRPSDTSGESQSKESEDKQPETDKEGDVEMEDGEIIEEDEIVEIPESPEPVVAPNSTEKEKTASEGPAQSCSESQPDADTSCERVESSGSESDDDSKSNASKDDGSESDDSKSKSKSQTSKKSTVDDDDDDIIDLGKDEDLDFEQLEMTTHKEPQQEETRRTRSKAKSLKSDERESSEPKVGFSSKGQFYLRKIHLKNY